MPGSTERQGTALESLELANALAPRMASLVRMLIRETTAIGVSRTQLSVLAALRDAGRPMRITELAHAERVTQPSMTVLVSRLERRGWAERLSDASDGRVRAAAITPEGAAALARLTAARAELLARRLEALTGEQRSALAAALPALDRLIDQQGEARDDPRRA